MSCVNLTKIIRHKVVFGFIEFNSIKIEIFLQYFNFKFVFRV